MNVEAFDYELPVERIAQTPSGRRDDSRLLRLDRGTGAMGHHAFHELPELLRSGDLVVFNDTRVLPVRLVGHKASGGRVELLLVERIEAEGAGETWRCLMKSARRPASGSRIRFGDGRQARVLEPDEGGFRVAFDGDPEPLEAWLAREGRMPLPPYIRREDAALSALDRERYQTVYARRSGAIAAPTAGLHFTPALLERVQERGIELAYLTLHVGLGTFLPVRAERVEDHEIHHEPIELSERVVAAVRSARERGGRVVSVGTTVVRALESCATDDGCVRAFNGDCGLFIYPGFRFRVVDAMITNFHLPRSTLLMLVSAFAGREHVLAAYREAIRLEYRFYSYGDAMLLESAA